MKAIKIVKRFSLILCFLFLRIENCFYFLVIKYIYVFSVLKIKKLFLKIILVKPLNILNMNNYGLMQFTSFFFV